MCMDHQVSTHILDVMEQCISTSKTYDILSTLFWKKAKLETRDDFAIFSQIIANV